MYRSSPSLTVQKKPRGTPLQLLISFQSNCPYTAVGTSFRPRRSPAQLALIPYKPATRRSINGTSLVSNDEYRSASIQLLFSASRSVSNRPGIRQPQPGTCAEAPAAVFQNVVVVRDWHRRKRVPKPFLWLRDAGFGFPALGSRNEVHSCQPMRP